jgi:phospholipid/cholesterol/gamma-HCH transport system substrate-binding protein
MRRRGSNGITPFKAGIVAFVIIAVASFFGFSRYNPFHDAFKIEATFESANNLKEKSPVRVAGVDVGIVTKVEPIKGGSGAARVEMEIDDRGLPIHEDAEFKVRPRIFLEGNFFVDLQPGTAGSPTVDENHEFPVNQTATPVQFGQVLTALQTDTREDLQVLLDEYARKGLGNGGAEAYNRSLDSAAGAFRNAAIANEASLGTERHDLSKLIRAQQRVFRALSANPETLRDLVTNLNRTTAAFAREDLALEAAIPALRDTLRAASPALTSINNSLPALRAFSIEALPGVRSSAPTIDASMPFVRQARRLVSESELKGLTRDLRPTIPALARVNRATIPFLDEARALSRCQNRVLVPFATEPIPDPDAAARGFADHTNQPFFKEAPHSLVGLASESRISDAQWPFFHVQFGSGLSSLVYTERGQQFFAQVPEPPEGVRPIRNNGRTRFRPDVPCETQEPPNMAAAGGGPDRTLTFNPVSDVLSEIIGDVGGIVDSLPVLRPRTEEAKERDRASYEQVNALMDYMRRKAKGQPAVSPMDKTQEQFRTELKRAGLMQLPNGHVVARRDANRYRSR